MSRSLAARLAAALLVTTMVYIPGVVSRASADGAQATRCSAVTSPGLASQGGRIVLRPGSRSRTVGLSGRRAINADLRFVVTLDRAATKAGAVVGAALRRRGSSHYRARLRVAGDGRVWLSFVEVRHGHAASVGGEVRVKGLTYKAGRKLRVRAQVQGTDPTRLRAKVWSASAGQPNGWHITRRDGSDIEASGNAGVGASLASPRAHLSGDAVVRFSELRVCRARRTGRAASCGSSLQAKVDAAPRGGTLVLSGCSYAAGATIDKPLTLVGATVRVPSGRRGFIISSSGVTLDRLTIVGPQSSGYSWNEVGVLTTGSVSGLVVRDSTIRNFGNAGVWVSTSSGARISGNTIEDVVYAGIMLISARDARVDGNAVRRIGVRGASANSDNAYGIAVSDEGGAVSSDVLVDGNTVATVPTWHGLDTHGGVRVTFRGNTVSGAPRALFITTDGSGRRATDIVVTDNRFLKPRGPRASRVTVTTASAVRVTVTGNTTVGWGSATFFHDYQGRSTGLKVSGNTIRR